MEMIQTEKLVYEYEKRDEEGNVIGTSRAIDEVDIEAKEGQFIAILGHNGSGKSTLAKHLNAILMPTEGSVWVNGKNTSNPRSGRTQKSKTFIPSCLYGGKGRCDRKRCLKDKKDLQ